MDAEMATLVGAGAIGVEAGQVVWSGLAVGCPKLGTSGPINHRGRERSKPAPPPPATILKYGHSAGSISHAIDLQRVNCRWTKWTVPLISSKKFRTTDRMRTRLNSSH